ncbi:MAG TPA: AAA family ATPase [Anaerolineae bacterium]|nr:AAA family ATPase [Anaerolineae bacterium]
MSRLSLYLLGPPRIESDGVVVKLDTRRAVALLSYLAVTGERHRRASLINLLWPEYDRSRGRAALRRTLYALRKALAGNWLDVDREEVGLDPGSDVWVDVNQFRQHLAGCETHGHPASQECPACAASLAEAVALYGGDFLAGFGLKDSINFDDWQFFQTDALRRELIDALQRLAGWHSTQREFEPAIGYARRWLALDSLDEEAHCQLMRLYAWCGQRSAALRQYGECVTLLQDQLGVPPQEATTELYAAIKEGHTPPPPEEWPKDRSVPPSGPLLDLPTERPSFLDEEGPLEPPVFVARERELAQLDRFLEEALAGRGSVVFVTGEAGAGKTALLQEFVRCAQAAHADLVAAWGHGNAHTGIGDPYLPFREILSLLTGDVEARWAAGAMTGEQARRLWHLLPQAVEVLLEVGPDLIELLVPSAALLKRSAMYAPTGSEWLVQLQDLMARRATVADNRSLQQSALFEQYSQMLRALASRRPLLLALDDLQWADGGSVNLLFHLGRQIKGSRILIVGSYRPAEIALGRPSSRVLAESLESEATGGVEGEHERHPLEPVVNEFKRTFGDIEVSLERAEGRQFVEAFLDSEPNHLGDAFREILYQHTRGVPLFTVELLRGMQERGDLVQDGNGRWVEGPALDWEMLPARVEAVIAERIGRLPEPLRDFLAVASVEGETFTAEVMAQVRTADERQTIRWLSGLLDRRYHLVSARGIERMGSRQLSRYRFRHILFQKHLYNSLDPVERAHLHRAVGAALEALYGDGPEQAAAIEAGAMQLARHFEEAGSAAKAIDYLRQAGERARRLYANLEALECFQRALVLLEDIPAVEAERGWKQETAIRLYESLGDVLEWTGAHDEARAAYGEALARVSEDDLLWRSHLHRKVGNVERLQHRYDGAFRAYDLAESTLQEGAAASTPEWHQEWVQIQLERMWMYYWLGQWHEMSESAVRVRPAVEQYGTATQCISFFLCLASMNNRRDRYVVSDQTLAFCQTALAIGQETENPGEVAWARFMLGFSQLWYGDLDGAEKQIQAALSLAEQSGDIVHQSRCLTYLTVLYRKRRELERARKYAARSLAVATDGEMVEYVGLAKANLAWVAWREGDLSRSEANGKAALELWQELPAGHSSCAFQWAALWPLIGVALAQNQLADASTLARALLEPTQQRLPGQLTTVVKSAIQAWDEGEAQTAQAYLEQAAELAQEMRFL